MNPTRAETNELKVQSHNPKKSNKPLSGKSIDMLNHLNNVYLIEHKIGEAKLSWILPHHIRTKSELKNAFGSILRVFIGNLDARDGE